MAGHGCTTDYAGDTMYTRLLPILICVFLLAGCNDDDNDVSLPGMDSSPAPTEPDGTGSGDDGDNDNNNDGDSKPQPPATIPETREGEVPESPDAGQTRDGADYRIVITGAHDEDVVFQVFEPTDFAGGETYPLILQSHGFGGTRLTERRDGLQILGANIATFLDAGYGVISIDERGHGDSGGTIRIMDPDFEGMNLVRVLDWAEGNLDWLAYGPDADAGEDNLLLGSTGASYGGGYQLVLNAIDPRKRMDAMVPQITWNDLTYSLAPQDVIKSGWVLPLFGIGNLAGDGFNFDPFVTGTLLGGAARNEIAPEGLDFFRYHGPGYFCEGEPVATNGGEGTEPNFAPVPPGPVNVMFWQGMRDTLFNFTEAYRNYDCFKQAGGDVRLLSYQSGHNVVPFPLDLGSLLSRGALLRIGDFDCGGVAVGDATLAFFNEHLKGQTGAANDVPELCMSLSEDDDYLPDEITVGGDEFELPTKRMISGVGLPDVPAAARLDYRAEEGDLLAGVPRIHLDVQVSEGADPLVGEPIFFVALGERSSPIGIFRRVDNQVTAIRGMGEHELLLPGVGERLSEGSQVAVLLYTLQDQYVVTGNVSAGGLLGSLGPLLSGEDDGLLDLPLVPITINGSVDLPIIRGADSDAE